MNRSRPEIEHELKLFEPGDKSRQEFVKQAIDSGKDVVIGPGPLLC